ncbi:MAG: hypothetical protein J5802_07920 [Butyrivibrio sp.]|nr:hypothetical protein [Butyrivibrio sp.]
MTTVISAKLTLAVRLVDTTTGAELTETDIRFYFNEERVYPMREGTGTYIFINMGKEDFLMRICACGYDDVELDINFDTLDPKLPFKDIFLMPSEKNIIGGAVIKISGNLPGLEFIEAIDLSHPIAVFQGMTTGKDIPMMNLLPMTLAGGVALDPVAYAMLSNDRLRYEVFTVQEQADVTSVMLKTQLKFKHEFNEKIFRIIYGRAGPEGDFILKVRDDEDVHDYLLFFRAGGREYIRPIDFHLETGEIDLTKGSKEQVTLEGKEEVKDE